MNIPSTVIEIETIRAKDYISCSDYFNYFKRLNYQISN
jgi:hypothetical protein